MSTETGGVPDKLPASAIFALLDGAPFGRLATYAPDAAGGSGRCYVLPLQFLHRDESIYLITTPGRKLEYLRASPRGVCFQLDLSEGAGWTSVCAWGDFSEVAGLRDRASVVMAMFTKYPERTSHQAVSWIRQHIPRPGALHGDAARAPVVGRLRLRSVSGRSWPGLLLDAGPALVHPAHRLAGIGPRSHPIHLGREACWALLERRPLARVGCYHPSRERTYCLPLWYAIEGNDLWFYHPGDGSALASALREHPEGVCVQVDNLDCSPSADPGQPWESVIVEGRAQVFTLGPDGALPDARQRALLRAIRTRLQGFGIESIFVPPDPDVQPPSGRLIRLHMQAMAGQATGEPL